MTEIYTGRCPEEKTDELIAVLDDVFFADEEKINFLALLPKLYKRSYQPAYNNFIVAENEEIKAAVGLYPLEAGVFDKTLKVGGIGNVAVSRDSRGKGYMIDCMNQCLEQMKSDGTVFSVLGGHRQRYQYFGYEPIGVSCWFRIDRRSIRHIKGAEYKTPFVARKVCPEDTEIIQKIDDLYKSTGIFETRRGRDYCDILASWNGTPYAAFEGDEFKGYFACGDEGNSLELKAVNTDDTINVILCMLDLVGKDELAFSIPPYDTDFVQYMMENYSSCRIEHSENTNVLDYKTFIEAYLGVKAKRIKLGEGTLKLLIHGYKRDEQLVIRVEGEKVSVSETAESPDYELDHIEAMRFIAGIYNKERNTLPDYAAAWFPLDFFWYCQDNV